MDVSRDLVYLRHIVDSAITIDTFVARGGKGYLTRIKQFRMGSYANLRLLARLVERCQTHSGQNTLAHIPWREIVGARDKLIHDYMGVDLERVWLMATNDVPKLKENVREILEAEGVHI